jgi:Fe-S-cluster containining protein
MINELDEKEICSIRCGSRCCKSTPPALTSNDIERIKRATEFNNWYYKIESEFGASYAVAKKEKSDDCIFLTKDSLCLIYENRPFDCKLFPFFIKIKRESETNFVLKWLAWYCPLTETLGLEKLKEKSKHLVELILSNDPEEIFEYQTAMFVSKGYKKKHFIMEERLKIIRRDK